MPQGYGSLGLDTSFFKRHIGWDIGAADVTRRLALHFGAPAVLAAYSRLLIDLNRGLDDPTLVMKLSDGAIIPGNRDVDGKEISNRIGRYYQPYHRVVDQLIDRALEDGLVPILISIHSFTPSWRGITRPWHIGLLWDNDDRVSKKLFRQFSLDSDIVVGDNKPYSGALKNDCLYTHGTKKGLPHVLIEIRQDLVDQPNGVTVWSEKISCALEPLAEDSELREIKKMGSKTDQRL